MTELAAFFANAVTAWKALPLGPFERGCIKAVVMGLFLYLIIYAIERIYGTRTNNYRSRMFFHDSMYWLYYSGNVSGLLFTIAFFAALEQPFAFFDLKLLTPLPFAVQIGLGLVIGDFIAYWIHRAEHYFKFMWAFHTTHHSQEKLTFATTARFHPVEHFYQQCLTYILIRMLGGDPMTWFPLSLIVMINTATQHTQIPWKLGPLYKLIATPTFHSYHHSPDPAHHDRNFGGVLSLWDYVFGTAVKDDTPKPSVFGLEYAKPTSFWSTLVTPFRLLYEFYVVPYRRKAIRSH